MVDFNKKEFWYMDYCNNCKDLDIMGSNDVPCHHPFYCWHDGGEVQELEAKIGAIKHNAWLRGYMCSHEWEELYHLRQEKFGLVKRKLREYRRKNK